LLPLLSKKWLLLIKFRNEKATLSPESVAEINQEEKLDIGLSF